MTRACALAFLCFVLAVRARAEDDPGKKLAAQSLYESAETALGQGEYAEARRALKVLIERYPSSAEALRGQRMLEAVPGADLPPPPEADAPYVPPMASTTPEDALSRLRAAIDGGHDAQALGDAYDYLHRYPNRPDRYEVGLAIAALHMRRGEPARALKFLIPLARAPGRAPALRTRALDLLGGALIALGRDADVLKAVPAVDPARATDRWLATAQIWRAAALGNMGRREDAAELYRAFAASDLETPARAYALAAIAADWDRLGKPDRARDALARASAEAKRWRLADLRDALALASANELTRARRLDDAAQAYLDFTRDFPKSPLLAQAYYERGLALKRLGRPNEAIKSFEALLDRAPDSVYASDAHLQLGQLDTELGLTQEALAHYRKMAKVSEAKDADREALLLMAQVHYNAKRWSDAIPLYRRYLKGAPEDGKTKEVEGLLLSCLWQADRDDPQVTALAAKLPDHPLTASIRWELATKAYNRKDWAAAAGLFQTQIEKDPHSPKTAEARYYRAEALRQLGKTSDAADAYRLFLDKHPKDARARSAAMNLGALLYESGDAAGAAAAYALVTGNDADAADAGYDRALALSKAGQDPAGAWEHFAARFPKHAKASGAWWTAGRLREEKLQNEAAAKDYEKATGPGEIAKSLYALGRLREKLKQTPAAKAAYEKLREAEPKDDASRLAGLLRLGLLLELADKPQEAAPLYTEITRLAEKGSPTFETARKRLDALK
ncbi:MAG: tetratricopeptide repeat protein [Elusimicrobia bacterium]|nr:tetratricopeptide repeat protein [Elusimicrobiota bacterium]